MQLPLAAVWQGGNAASAGRALLTAEQLLQEEGRLSEEWTDVWQLPWRRQVMGDG